MKNYEHEFYVTRKCTKYEYFTVKANSMEEAKDEAENGFDYYNFDWEEFDYESVDHLFPQWLMNSSVSMRRLFQNVAMESDERSFPDVVCRHRGSCFPAFRIPPTV